MVVTKSLCVSLFVAVRRCAEYASTRSCLDADVRRRGQSRAEKGRQQETETWSGRERVAGGDGTIK